jgi:hypothetical protein
MERSGGGFEYGWTGFEMERPAWPVWFDTWCFGSGLLLDVDIYSDLPYILSMYLKYM